MDSFERQDKARRNTKLLVFYFVLAVIFLILAVYGAVALIFTGAELKDDASQVALFSWTAIGTMGVILIGSVSRTLALARGGGAVAELLEGRLVNSNTIDLNERKLLNVVEEMAIASGVPVPQVYVMDGEAGINAFAAGHTTGDAAISVTRGCITILSRDELQGVIAHEFSHILNGDMRLNLRLIGLIFGILCLTIIGRILIRTRGKKNPLPLLGLALIIIGWIGVLFGRLIQAAVSRQREVLADASAVQFTRNPAGLANALKKIGGLGEGSHLHAVHAEEASHLFFADGLGKKFLSFATHPPLNERILALDPSFDGKFPTVVTPDSPPPIPSAEETAQPPPIPTSVPPPLPVVPLLEAEMARIAPHVVTPKRIVADIGRPKTEHLRYAIDLQEAIPPSLQADTRDPLAASALVCAFLLSQDPTTRQQQLDELAGAASEAMRQEASRLWPAIQGIPPQARIPLIDLSLPALRRLSPEQFSQFRAAVNLLVASDNKTDLFEFMLQKIVMRHLETHFVPARKQVTQFYDLRPLTSECGVLLSATAYAGHENATAAHAAFEQGAALLQRIARSDIPWLPPGHCDLPQVEAALDRLSQAVPQIKKNVLNACAETVAADGVIQEREAELLRAVADSLDCPIPPFVQPPRTHTEI